MTNETLLIGVPTYRRPESLRALLKSLEAQTEKLTRERIVVVDNDAHASAQGTVRSFERSLPIQYVVEPRRGLAEARNKILDQVRDEDALVFLDDDMWVDAYWLAALREGMRAMPDHILAGPLSYVLPKGAFHKAIVAAFRSMGTPNRAAVLMNTGAGNTLLPRKIADEGHRFSTEFSSLGGEDTEFFGRLVDLGHVISVCPGAQAYEEPGNFRATRSWLCRRAIDSGEIRGRIELKSAGRNHVIIGAVARICLGAPLGLWKCLTLGKIWPQHFNTLLSGLGFARALRRKTSERY